MNQMRQLIVNNHKNNKNLFIKFVQWKEFVY